MFTVNRYIPSESIYHWHAQSRSAAHVCMRYITTVLYKVAMIATIVLAVHVLAIIVNFKFINFVTGK